MTPICCHARLAHALPPVRGKLLPDVAWPICAGFVSAAQPIWFSCRRMLKTLRIFSQPCRRICRSCAGRRFQYAGARWRRARCGHPLGRSFRSDCADGEHELTAGAAALMCAWRVRRRRRSIAGLEFYRGIPGAIGGAIAMNAGAYGGETCDVLGRC